MRKKYLFFFIGLTEVWNYPSIIAARPRLAVLKCHRVAPEAASATGLPEVNQEVTQLGG